MSHNSKAKAKGISSSSFFDLKAELAKQEEESRRNRATGKSATIIGGVPRPGKVCIIPGIFQSNVEDD
jgi:hypothetical protein